MGGFLFLNTLYLQDVRGLSPLRAGLYTLPMAGMMLVVAPLTGRFIGNRGTRAPLVAGAVALVASGVILAQLTDRTSFGTLIVAYALLGLGSGMINPPITNTAVSGMPPSHAGVAAAVASTGRSLGQTLGVAMLGSLAGGATRAITTGFTASTHASWYVVAGLGVGILVLGLMSTTAWAGASAGRTADLFRDDTSRLAPGHQLESERTGSRRRVGAA
jgi:MFS family permease